MAASQDVRWREQSIRLQSLRDAGAEDTGSDRPTQALDHRETNRLADRATISAWQRDIFRHALYFHSPYLYRSSYLRREDTQQQRVGDGVWEPG